MCGSALHKIKNVHTLLAGELGGDIYLGLYIAQYEMIEIGISILYG